MDISDFKEVELKRGSNIKALFNGKQFRRTLIFMLLGAGISFIYFYYTEGQHMDILKQEDIFKSLSIGALFGIFISNSPCARGKC